jgi:hypothetical protein
MKDDITKCECEFCKIYKRIQSVESTWDEVTRGIVNDLGDIWEDRSTDACYWKSKYMGTWPITEKVTLLHEIIQTEKRLETLKQLYKEEYK